MKRRLLSRSLNLEYVGQSSAAEHIVLRAVRCKEQFLYTAISHKLGYEFEIFLIIAVSAISFSTCMAIMFPPFSWQSGKRRGKSSYRIQKLRRDMACTYSEHAYFCLLTAMPEVRRSPIQRIYKDPSYNSVKTDLLGRFNEFYYIEYSCCKSNSPGFFSCKFQQVYVSTVLKPAAFNFISLSSQYSERF